MRKISSVLSLILAVCLSIGGVSAAWAYAAGAVEEVIQDLVATMGEWEFGYTISFVNNGANLVDPVRVTDNTTEFVIMKQDVTGVDNVVNASAKTAAQNAETEMGQGFEFSHWINAGSTRIDSIPADNTENITLYPSFVGVYTAMFVDHDGNILAWDTFTANNTGYNKIKGMGTDSLAPDMGDDFEFNYWEVHETDNEGNTTDSYKLTELSGTTFGRTDITIYPIYTFKGDVNLIPIDSNGDGNTDSYQVGGYGDAGAMDLVEIPSEVNGLPITSIADNAFASYDGVHAVVIPNTITSTGNNILANKQSSWFDAGDTVTIYYKGTYADWLINEPNFGNAWDTGISSSSIVYFLGENGKVDPTQGYLTASVANGSLWNQGDRAVTWSAQNTINQNYINTMYTKQCNCSEGDHDYGITAVYDRIPDYIYWGAEDGSGSITMPTS